ncbi:helix-turn-helix domain-containing protein [Paenibacillus thalictri]|uniref:Helix-turn-helix domain-containing protein n=1 Tax=Paenibacillus thalictri TaxID=2527873 RepID=A0A4Q9DVH5_9BACL|nr:helix-turn-helix domain-containing protein [Paenibacillus thalictri]TBL81044.1 helix-turn-helix domain-containing protein [Paenibacillus thalictri]
MLNVFKMGSGKRSVRFYKLFLSYLLLVLFVVTAVGGMVYINIISALQNEVEQAQLSSVAQFRDTMETRLRELQRISVQISTNPLLTPYVLSQYGYDSYQAVAELNKYRTSNSFIHNIVLKNMSYDSSRLFAASGVYEQSEFFSRIYSYENWGAEALEQQIRTMTGPVVRPAETVYTSSRTQYSTFVTYMYPLPAYSGKPYGAILFLLDVDVLQAMAEHLVSRPGTFLYLLDEKGNTVFSANRDKLANPPFERANADKRSISTRSVMGITYTVIRQEFASNGWSLVQMVPTSQFIEKVDESRRLFGIVLLALIVIGTALSFLLANNNYQKLRQLVQMFSDGKGRVKENGSMDEMVYLSNAIREMSGQESMMIELKSKKSLIRENVLLSLFKNKPQPPEGLAATLELAEIRFDYDHFVSLLLAIDDYTGFQTAYSGSMQELLKFSILNAAEELASETGRGYGVSIVDDRGIALAINIKDTSSYKQQLESFASRLQTFFQSHYKFTLSIGVGRLYREPGSIGLSFEEARQALQYRFVKGSNQILFHELLPAASREQARSYPHELEDRLFKSMRQGNAEEAETTIRSMTDSIRVLSVTPESARLACAGLLHSLMKISEELQGHVPEGLYGDTGSLNVQRAETMDQLETEMIGICRRVCEHVCSRMESRNFKLRDDIIQFLHERYADNSLSLDTIADHFGMSPSYITRFIKDQTGSSLIRYLDQLRMAKAKELLVTGTLNLADVTSEVGYVDVSNFIKKFKKQEGVTPEQYRKLHAAVENRPKHSENHEM